ncbi:hypothetical protein N566_17565, partial [Streptomycetaceae bacterium MP113-05]
MTYDIPLTPRPFQQLNRHDRQGRPVPFGTGAGTGTGGETPARVLTASMLRAHHVTAAETRERCRPGGPWRMLLPGVFLLHPGPPTSEDRLHAVLLYTVRRQTIPSQAPRGATGPGVHRTDAMITGSAALALHGLAGAPPLPALEHIDVLVPATRRLRSAGFARVVRSAEPPVPDEVAGLPVAPVERALADAVAARPDPEATARLLTAPHVAGAVDR